QRRRCRRAAGCRFQLAIQCLEDRRVPSYSITDLGTFGGTISDAYGINSRGEVVGGAALACNCVDHPFLWYNGLLGDLSPSQEGSGNGINDRGQVVGKSVGEPFLWSREAGMQSLGFFGTATSVNNHTEIVGTIGPYTHAFFWKDGKLDDLGTLYGGVSGSADI